MKRAPALAVALALAPLSIGCSTFDHIEFSLRSTPPVAAAVSYDEIRVPEGVAVIVVATPMSTEGTMSEDTKVELRAEDPSVLGVGFALPGGAREGSGEQWTFVLLGAKAGSATVAVSVDGVSEKNIPAVVEAQ